jgi:hypothetical protein
MRKFRVEINGKIHEVKIEEINEEVEVQIAVIAAAISAYLESEKALEVISAAPSRWGLAGRRNLMTPLKRDIKMPARIKAAQIKVAKASWSLAGRQELMRGVWVEEI